MTETLFYVMCTSLPSHVIVFYQYWNCPWRARKTAIFLVCVNVVVKLLTVAWFLEMGRPIRGLELVFSAACIVVYSAAIRINISKLFFTYVLVLDYLVAVRGLSSFAAVRLFSAGPQSWQSSAVCLLLYVLTLPWLLRFFRKTVDWAYGIRAPALWHVIWLAPALTSAVVLIFTDAFNVEDMKNWTSLLARVILMVCVFVAYYVLLQALAALQRQAALEEQARQNENILTLQRTQYAALQSHMEDIRRTRHDLRQHHNIIQSFLDSGDTTNLRAYLLAQQDVLPADNLKRYCSNYAVNMLLNHYAGQLNAAGVDFEFRVELPEQLKLPEPDVCVVLGNLLENARDACVGQKEPYVRAAARCGSGGELTIVVDNTAPEPPRRDADGTFRSTKPSGSGIGIQSVRYVAQRYGGMAEFDWHDGMFFASVFLKGAAGTEEKQQA